MVRVATGLLAAFSHLAVAWREIVRGFALGWIELASEFSASSKASGTRIHR